MINYNELVEILRNCGLEHGDTVLLHTDLLRCGPVDVDIVTVGREGIMKFYLDGFTEVLGAKGTLITPAYTGTHFGRLGKSFDRMRTPSEVSVFGEFMRNRQGAVRSMHPIMSLSAYGAKAEEICGGAHFDAFGYDSPWGRMHRMNAKILTLGYAIFPSGMTFWHYFENLYGVPYQYNKLFDYPVLDDGKPIEGIFTMSVRYLEYDVQEDQCMAKRRLVESGKGHIFKLGCGELLVTTFDQAVEVGIEVMRENRYVLLATPPTFIRGEKPFDDNTLGWRAS